MGLHGVSEGSSDTERHPPAHASTAARSKTTNYEPHRFCGGVSPRPQRPEIDMTETTEKPEDYEELFVHRYTSEDREYQEYLKRPPDPPPIVENWRGRSGGGHRGGRDNRYQDRRGGYGSRDWGSRGYGEERGWRGEQRGHWQDRDRGRDQAYGRDRDRDRVRSWDREGARDRGYRGGYQPHPQGYNSQHQRPQYDRY